MSAKEADFDQQVIALLCRDVGKSELVLLLASLETEIATCRTKITKAYAASDWQNLELLSHSIKSAADSFGLVFLAHTAAILEKAANSRLVTRENYLYVQKACEAAPHIIAQIVKYGKGLE